LKDSGKAIAIRLAEDGYDVCINDVAANKAGIEEANNFLFSILFRNMGKY